MKSIGQLWKFTKLRSKGSKEKSVYEVTFLLAVDQVGIEIDLAFQAKHTVTAFSSMEGSLLQSES